MMPDKRAADALVRRPSLRACLLASAVGSGLMIGLTSCAGRPQTASSGGPSTDCWLLTPEQRAAARPGACDDAFAGSVAMPPALGSAGAAGEATGGDVAGANGSGANGDGGGGDGGGGDGGDGGDGGGDGGGGDGGD